MNPLIKARVEKFATNYGFSGTLQQKFEKWATNLLVGNALRSDPLLIEQAVVGGSDDGGIDGAAVIVNGNLVTDPGEIEDLREDERDSNTVRLKFLQAKSSQNFNAPMASKFLNGVERLANAAASGGISSLEKSLRPTAQILEAVIKNIDLFNTPELEVDIYYVTTADHPGTDVARDPQVVDAVEKLRSLQVFKKVEPLFLGTAELQERIAEMHGVQNVPIFFEKKVALPHVPGVEQAHIGFLPVAELANLLLDGNGALREGIFDDNVRLYQGRANRVNKKIAATLNSDNRSMFPYLNNGLTIVARKLSNISDNFQVSGYQIVNGCQTSNEIANWMYTLGFENADGEARFRVSREASEVVVPVKVIQTSRSDILSQITIATNLQTSIGDADIQGSSQLAKDVEEYFENTGANGLRYERQLGETTHSVAKTRTINTSELNRAFAAAILGESSTAIGSPKNLQGRDSEVWSDYPLFLYYFAAWIAYRVDRMLAINQKGIRPAKYHLIMLSAVLSFPEIEDLHSGGAKKRIKQKIAKSVSNSSWEEKLEEGIKQAEEIVVDYFSSVLEEKSIVKDDVRSKRVQEELFDLAKKKVSPGENRD